MLKHIWDGEMVIVKLNKWVVLLALIVFGFYKFYWFAFEKGIAWTVTYMNQTESPKTSNG